MKSLIYILTLLILVLSVHPCADKPEGERIREISQTTGQDQHDGLMDYCSPFCTCQCCQTTFFIPADQPVSPVSELLFSYDNYSLHLKSSDPSELLVPPKA